MAAPATATNAPIIAFQSSFSLKQKWDIGSMIIGMVAINVDAIPTFANSIATKLSVIQSTGPKIVPIKITLAEQRSLG